MLAVLRPERRQQRRNPCRIAVLEKAGDSAGARIGLPNLELILKAVQLMDRERARLPRPSEAGNVAFAGIAGKIQPPRAATGGRDHADAHRGVGGSGLWIGEMGEHRIKTLRGVHDREFAYAARIVL
jgi:hypothetical protein